MTASDLIADLERQGVRISLHGETVQFRGQTSRVSPEQRATLAAKKPELISFLRQRSANANAVPEPPRRTVSGRPATWTGKIVSEAAWRELSDWERFGPNGRYWNGLTRRWEQRE